jgi:benzil reductase ((S)-benzoin forming)
MIPGMTTKLALVTGTSSGLGLAVAEALLGRGWRVLGVARRPAPLAAPGYLHQRLDLGDLDALEAFVDGPLAAALAEPGIARLGLVNGAAVLGPVGPLRRTRAAPLAEAFLVNAVAPLRLLGALSAAAGGRPLRAVDVSSGAARRAYAGWSAYCATKAALRMGAEVAALEAGSGPPRAEAAIDLAVVSYEPGVVDTAMQAAVRGASPSDFPGVQRFIDLHASGRLVAPAAPAAEIAALLDQDGLPAWSERRHGG